MLSMLNTLLQNRLLVLIVYGLFLFNINLVYAEAEDNSYPEYATEEDIADPFENFNRHMYKLDMALYHVILKPIAKTYVTLVPSWGQNRISDFSNNLGTPVIFVNNLLQKNLKQSFISFWRFILNTTLGIGGLLDIANELGLPRVHNDFGITMATYKVKTGPYIMLPLFGSSTMRDTTGKLANILIDPLTYILNKYQLSGRFTLETLEGTIEHMDLIDQVNKTALDPYAMMRSLYVQHRQQEIRSTKKLDSKL